jgi:hypothetical protein
MPRSSAKAVSPPAASMSLVDSRGVIVAECKPSVYTMSIESFTPSINNLFTILAMKPDRLEMARFAVSYAEKEKGWNKAELGRRLFGADTDARGRVGNWLRRGLPPEQDAPVAALLGLTIEELHAAGGLQIKEPSLSADAIAIAKAWDGLPAQVRLAIQTLILNIPKEPGRIEGEAVERPTLQRHKRPRAAV